MLEHLKNACVGADINSEDHRRVQSWEMDTKYFRKSLKIQERRDIYFFPNKQGQIYVD